MLSPSHLLLPNGWEGELAGAWPSSYQPAGSASLFLKGTSSEGEFGWFWQFSGWVGWLVCLFVLGFCLFVPNGFSLFPAGALPGGVCVCVFWGVVESKDLCAPSPCCEMQTCACFASLAEAFFLKKKAPDLLFYSLEICIYLLL